MKKVRTTIYLDASIREAIREIEYQDKTSMAIVIINAITDYLHNRLKDKENKIA